MSLAIHTDVGSTKGAALFSSGYILNAVLANVWSLGRGIKISFYTFIKKAISI